MTGSYFGKPNMVMGAANVYYKPKALGSWADNTGWTSVGLTGAVMTRRLTSFGELKAAQKGDTPWNKAITGVQVQAEIDLAEAELETLNALDPVFSIKTVLGVTKQGMIVNKTGATSRDNLYWFKFVELIGSVESTDPVDTLYMLGAPEGDQAESTHDATTPRVYHVMLQSYENTDVLTQVKDTDGYVALAWTGEIV